MKKFYFLKGGLTAVFLLSLMSLFAQPMDSTQSDALKPASHIVKSNKMMTQTVSGTITAASPTQTGRLNRNGIASTCAAPKICDIFLSDPGRLYDVQTFTNNTAAPICTDIVLDPQCTEGNVGFTVYLGAYDPVNICTNYLADPGLSSGIPQNTVSLETEIPAGATANIVIFITNVGQTCEVGGGYDLTVSDQLTSGSAPPPPVPTLSQWGLIILSLLMMSLVLVFAMAPKVATPTGQTISVQNFAVNTAEWMKTWAGVALVTGLGFVTAMNLFGYELTNADPIGALVASGIVAYMIMKLKK